MLGLFWERVTKTSVFTGMVAGVATAVILAIFKMDPIGGLNAGFVGLGLNFLLTFSLSAIAPATPRGARIP